MRKWRLKLVIFISFAFYFVSLSFAQSDLHLPLFRQLLDDAISSLPTHPLFISGDLIVRKRRGVLINKLKLTMSVQWGITPATANYTIIDKSGMILEEVKVTYYADKMPVFKREDNNHNIVLSPYDIFKPIENTDITWMDLSFSFLWWNLGEVMGIKEIKGRKCYLVKIFAPYDLNQYSYIMLWLDKDLHMLLKAEGYNKNNKLIRSLWIKSFKKIKNKWMIKDIEIQAYPSIHRTKLHINEVSVNTQL